MLSSAKASFQIFITSPVFLACLFSWFSAQFIKTLIKLFMGKVKTLGELFELLFWRTGGMPSSHSALVTSLATSIGLRSGVSSDVFVLSMGFLLITIRDALGVRRASGIQAKTLNEMGKMLKEKGLMEFKQIKEIQGHTPIEVLLGCVVGFFSGLAFCIS